MKTGVDYDREVGDKVSLPLFFPLLRRLLPTAGIHVSRLLPNLMQEKLVTIMHSVVFIYPILLIALQSSVAAEVAGPLNERALLSPRQSCPNPTWVPVCPG